MGNLDDELRARQNALEKILVNIPGFKGYLEREYRREADHLLRQFMVRRLGEAKRELEATARELTDRGQINRLRDLGSQGPLLEKVENQIRFASHGYAGFFDLAKIRQAEIDRLYAFDLKLIESVNEICAQVKKMAQTVDDEVDFRAAARGCTSRLGDFDRLMEQRDMLVRGFTE